MFMLMNKVLLTGTTQLISFVTFGVLLPGGPSSQPTRGHLRVAARESCLERVELQWNEKQWIPRTLPSEVTMLHSIVSVVFIGGLSI